MKAIIVSITDAEKTAKVLDTYFCTSMAEAVESCFMTYRQTLLSGRLVRQADLFVVELFSLDTIGPRAEGIFVAEKWLSLGKRAMIVSGTACADAVRSMLYWDLASEDRLMDRIKAVLAEPVASPYSLASVRAHFSKFCRAAEDPHNAQLPGPDGRAPRAGPTR